MSFHTRHFASMNTIKICTSLLLLFALCFPAKPAVASNEDVKVGVFPFKPLIFTNSDGVASGIYADLINQIAKENEWNLTYVPGSWSEGLERVKTGDLDLITSVMYTENRDRYLDYSKEPFFVVWGEVYVLPDASIANIIDLDGKKVALMEGDRNGANFRELADKFDIKCEFVEVRSHNDVFSLIKKKEVDAGVVPNLYGFHNALSTGLVHTIVFNPSPLYCAVPEGMNKKILADIDATLKRWKKDPDSYYHKTMDYWLSHEVSQKEIIPQWLIATVLLATIFILLMALWNKTLKSKVKQRTLELAKSEERFHKMFRNHNAVMMLIDPQSGTIVDANKSACDYYGYSLDQIKRLSIHNINTLGKTEVESAGKKILSGKQNFFEFKHKNATGEIRDVEVHSSPIIVENQDLVFSIIHDISERKKLMKEQSRSAQLAALGTVAAGVAHEINNPIQGIMNYATLIKNAPEKVERITDLSQRIINESQRVANITSDLLYYSKDNVLSKVSSDINDLLRRAISLIETKIVRNGVAIETSFAEDLPAVDVNAQGIQQIAINLLDNAYDAVRAKDFPTEKKVVTVKTELGYFDTAAHIVIEVSDKGVGMSEDVLERSKEAFFSTKPSSEGTGLGLSIVQDIVSRHGGQIEIDSVEGEYTSIRVLLPILANVS